MVEQADQLVGPRAFGEAGLVGGLVVADGLGEGFRDAAVGEDGGGEGVVVGLQALLLQCGELSVVFALREQAAVDDGVHRGQRKAADASHQAAGKQFVRGADPALVRQGLAGHRHQQGVGPEVGVVEGFAGAALVLVHQRKPHRELAHGGHPEAHHRLGDGHEGAPRAIGCSAVGELQDAAGEGRIGLHDAGDLVDAGIVPAADFHDRQCHALGARQLAAEAQLFYRHAVGLVRFGGRGRHGVTSGAVCPAVMGWAATPGGSHFIYIGFIPEKFSRPAGFF